MSFNYAIFLTIFVFAQIFIAPSDGRIEQDQKEKCSGKTVKDFANLKLLVEEAQDYAHKIGMIMRTPGSKNRSDIAAVAPVTLFPTQVPREIYEQATAVQEAMTLLYFRVSRDYKFLKKILGEVAKTDRTINFLMDVLEQVQREGVKQHYNMIWQRADYMIHEEDEDDTDKGKHYQLKQIEVNNGAAAGYIAEHVTEFHQRMLSKAGIAASLPENPVFDTVSNAIYSAWKQFDDPNAIIIVMVHKNGALTHFVDHEILYHLEKLGKDELEIVYMNVVEAYEKLTLADDSSLRFGDKKVGVVFYRVTFLRPWDFFPEQAWEVRRTIERSTAIKCPTVGTLLASTKKVQQVLAQPNMVEHFFPDPKDADKVKAIRATFAGLWGLEKDDAKTKHIIQDAITHPERYVLKPNREGGGNNIWGEEIAEQLQSFTPQQRAEHILMQRLQPKLSKNFFIRPMEEPEYGDVAVELGTFGYIVGNSSDGTVIHSGAKGYFLRTKWADTNECGINVGSGVYDTPLLI